MCAAGGAHAQPRQQRARAHRCARTTAAPKANERPHLTARAPSRVVEPCRTSTRARLFAATPACRTPTRRTSRCATGAARRQRARSRASRTGLYGRPVDGSGVAVLQGRHRSAAAAQARRRVACAFCARPQQLTAPAPLQPGPRDGDVRGGVQAEAARPRPAVHGQAAGAPPPASPPQPYRLCTAAAGAAAARLACACVRGRVRGRRRRPTAARRAPAASHAASDAPPQSPIAEDQVLPHTKAPRIVKWKLDRLW